MLDENIVAELVQRRVVTDTFRRLSAEKKTKLYRAALQLFGKYGYDGLAVDQFCMQARISKGSFFQYFPSKSHLLEFTLLAFDNQLAEHMESFKRSETAVLARDRLRQLFAALSGAQFLSFDEKMFYLFVVNALNHSAVAVVDIHIERHISGHIISIIRRGVETKEIRADYNSTMTAGLVALLMNSLLSTYFLRHEQPDDETEQYFISFMFDGIKS